MAGRADGREARQGGGRDTRGEGEERGCTRQACRLDVEVGMGFSLF